MIQLDPESVAYGLGFDAGLEGLTKQYPGEVSTPEEREKFDEGYVDGTQARLVRQEDAVTPEDNDG